MIVIAKETLGFRCAGISPALWLLMPTFSLLTAPPSLTTRLHCSKDAPLPPRTVWYEVLIFGIKLSPYEFTAQNSLASKLLRFF